LERVERDVGVAQQIFGPLVARVRDRNADAGRRVEAAAFDVRRFGNGGVQPLDARFDIFIEEDDAEFIAAQPRDHFAGPHDRTQALRDRAQQRIAGEMAEAVVDDLEVVEVDEGDRETGQARAQRIAELGGEEAAVGRLVRASCVASWMSRSRMTMRSLTSSMTAIANGSSSSGT